MSSCVFSREILTDKSKGRLMLVQLVFLVTSNNFRFAQSFEFFQLFELFQLSQFFKIFYLIPQACCALRGSYVKKRDLGQCRSGRFLRIHASVAIFPWPPARKFYKNQKLLRNGSPWLQIQHKLVQTHPFFEPHLVAGLYVGQKIVFDKF